MMPMLGRLEQIPIRQVWPLEDKDFTPWLAEPDNLGLLADTLRLGELRLQGTELPVGSFNLDILAQDIEGNSVLIENQFGPTDHTHLGQILTYLAGQPGNATVIWIAERIREEHRAAIDWLNASTRDAFNFYAIQVEALKIGNSPPAPRFNVVAKPNTVSRDVGRVTRSADNSQLDERAKMYVAYWSGFGAFLQENGAPYKMPTPPRDYWCNWGIGRSGFVLSVAAGFRDKRLAVEVYINHRAAKRAFDLLIANRTAIEGEIGEPLTWQRTDDLKSSRVGVYRTDLDPRDESQRPAQYAWFLDHMRRFSQAFGSRIRNLQLDDTSETEANPPSVGAADEC
jgi:Domain of unknown function (DUF4268)